MTSARLKWRQAQRKRWLRWLFGYRYCLCRRCPRVTLFILDEPGTALDEENMEGFIRILELIKVYFKNVLLISHLDSLKDCVDMQIVIDKKHGYARVNQ